MADPKAHSYLQLQELKTIKACVWVILTELGLILGLMIGQSWFGS